jgi:hypothetical protein
LSLIPDAALGTPITDEPTAGYNIQILLALGLALILGLLRKLLPVLLLCADTGRTGGNCN